MASLSAPLPDKYKEGLAIPAAKELNTSDYVIEANSSEIHNYLAAKLPKAMYVRTYHTYLNRGMLLLALDTLNDMIADIGDDDSSDDDDDGSDSDDDDTAPPPPPPKPADPFAFNMGAFGGGGGGGMMMAATPAPAPEKKDKKTKKRKKKTKSTKEKQQKAKAHRDPGSEVDVCS